MTGIASGLRCELTRHATRHPKLCLPLRAVAKRVFRGCADDVTALRVTPLSGRHTLECRIAWFPRTRVPFAHPDPGSQIPSSSYGF